MRSGQEPSYRRRGRVSTPKEPDHALQLTPTCLSLFHLCDSLLRHNYAAVRALNTALGVGGKRLLDTEGQRTQECAVGKGASTARPRSRFKLLKPSFTRQLRPSA